MKNLFIAFICLFLAIPCTAGKIIYVDVNAPGAIHNGSSWENAYNYLQDALANAQSGDGICVAQGIYKPDQGVGITTGDREATFQLINGVAIKGGYAGFGATDPNSRDIEAYETTLSGDLNGNDLDVVEPCDLLFQPTRCENSYHVITTDGINHTSVLDGFTIAGGNANHEEGSWHCIGGGMRNSDSNLIVKHCTFKGNSARFAGGMFNYGSNPKITHCIFSGNSAGSAGGMNNWNSNPTIINCTFSHNRALGLGGGMQNYPYSNPMIISCTFIGNSASIYGGGIFNYHNSSPNITNCTFSGNSANELGGGIYNEWYSEPSIISCIFWSNIAPNSPEIYNDGTSSLQVTYSNVRGGWEDQGNIDADPRFVEAGFWADVNDPNIIVEPNDPNAVWIDGDYHLLEDSPCIDAGDPNYVAGPNETDLDGLPRIIGGRVDMGAYEYWPPVQAEMKFTPQRLNCKSKGNWVKAHIVLPEGISPDDVDVNEPAFAELSDEMTLDSEYIKLLGSDDGLVRLEIVFDRQVFCELLMEGDCIVARDDSVEITVVGYLTTGQYFYGSDIIKIKH